MAAPVEPGEPSPTPRRQAVTIAEKAARTRAARGHAGMSQKQLAEELRISVETLSRMENARRDISAEELDAIAQITDVPRAFFEVGFVGLHGDLSSPADRELRDMRDQIRELSGQMAGTVSSVTELTRRVDVIYTTNYDELLKNALARAAAETQSTETQSTEPQTIEKATAEEALDQLQRATRIMQELLGQLGRDVGRRDLESRGGTGRRRESPGVAA